LYLFINLIIKTWLSIKLNFWFLCFWIWFYSIQSIILKFVFICVIGYELNNPSNESMLKENTNLTLTDGPLQTNIDTAEKNTSFGNKH